MSKRRFEEIGKAVGALVEEKNEAYGDSFQRSQEILKVLFPEEIRAVNCQVYHHNKVQKKVNLKNQTRELMKKKFWTEIKNND